MDGSCAQVERLPLGESTEIHPLDRREEVLMEQLIQTGGPFGGGRVWEFFCFLSEIGSKDFS